MTEGKTWSTGGGACHVIHLFIYIYSCVKYMSVVSYTDVCVINVAAEMFIAAALANKGGGRRREWRGTSGRECYLYKMS